MMDDDLIDFMRRNQFDEKTINLFLEEKITKEDVSQMDTKDLENIVPSLRQRLMLRNFCQKCKTSSTKLSLLEKVALRMTSSSGNTNKPSCSRNAEKDTRFIEVGLACYSATEGVFKTVRSNKGGGTRRLSMSKNASVKEILVESKEVFFPGGTSPLGELKSFLPVLLDFKLNQVDDEATIGALYKKTKFKILRFYLGLTEIVEIPSSGEEDVIELPSVFPGDDVQFAPFVASSGGFSEFDETIPCHTSTPVQLQEDNIVHAHVNVNDIPDTSDDPPRNQLKKTLTIHRENVLIEMISAFQDKELMNSEIDVEVILPNGQKEQGQGAGVWRDIITAFWDEFQSKLTLGKGFKVPFLRHDFQTLQWEAVARIILKGYQVSQYFPTFLAPVFMDHVLSGKDAPNDELVRSFFKYIPEQERELFQKALDNFTCVEIDELIDILDVYQCKVFPTSSNMHRILEEISHKELVQQPSFVAECWREILKPLKQVNFTELYETLQPTVKKVLDKLQYPQNLSTAESATVSYLKRFIRNLNKKELASFLRFCTGCDLLFSEKISVRFSNLSGLERRPVAHTCGCVLELSITYESFPDFRNEFLQVLNSGVWVMDIV